MLFDKGIRYINLFTINLLSKLFFLTLITNLKLDPKHPINKILDIEIKYFSII